MGHPPAPWEETAEPFDPAAFSSASGRKRRERGSKAGGRKPLKPHGKRRNVLYILLALVLIIPTAAAAYVYGLGRTYDDKTTEIESVFPDESLRPPPRTAPAEAGAGVVPFSPVSPISPVSPVEQSAPLNILFLGSDSRNASTEQAAAGASSNQRADAIMLVHIPADRSAVYSISLMRDLWVNIPGRGSAKINAALAFGGVPLMVRTIEDLLKQRIDHVAMMDFEGFKGLTDALGGVEVTIDRPFTSHHERLEFRAGTTTLDGERALAFVRERYAYADGDYQRVRNQQAFLRAVIGKMLSAGTLANPLTVHNVLDSTASYISVDAGLNAATLGSLAISLRDLRQDDVAFFTLPTSGTGWSADGQSIVIPDAQAIRAMAAALGNDTLGDYVAARGLEDGN